jgi:hypothetical protein
MQFFSVPWFLLLVGFLSFLLSLVILTKGPSRAQMLLMGLGVGEVCASMIHWVL